MSQQDQLKHEIDEYVDRVWPEVMQDIASLVAEKSVEELDRAAPGAPWGPGPRAALDEALCIANRLGLAAHDCDGYIGYAEVPGASAKQIATIAHVDVVPEGPGWHTDPYKMVVRDGWLLGRGVIDDKGPAVLTLHMARFFAERLEQTGTPLPYTLRILLGANEETGMGDLTWYLKEYEQPAFLFTPDADFPVCCGEKGNYSGLFASACVSGPVAGARIIELAGGSASNAIPSLAHAVVRADAQELPQADHFEIEAAGTDETGAPCARITAHGIGGHASLPAGTRNAIGMLASYLLEHEICSDAERRVLELESHIHASTDGSGLGIAASDDIFEPLTCVGGTIALTPEGKIQQTIDIRFPTSTTAEALTTALAEQAKAYGCTYTLNRSMPPFYVEPTSPEIQTLVRSYNEYTGRHEKPFTIGGGTYARHFKNAASFGPEDSSVETPQWVGQMHGPDEGASEEHLKLSLKIYIYAVAELMKLDL